MERGRQDGGIRFNFPDGSNLRCILSSGEYAAVSGLGTLRKFQFDHLNLLMRSRFGKHLAGEISFFVSRAEITRSDLEYKVASLQVIRTDAAFSRVMREIPLLRAAVQRHDRMGPRRAAAPGRLVQT